MNALLVFITFVFICQDGVESNRPRTGHEQPAQTPAAAGLGATSIAVSFTTWKVPDKETRDLRQRGSIDLRLVGDCQRPERA
jgi:hypothetical protein